MTHYDLTVHTITSLKKAILLQQNLYKLNHQLEKEGNAEYGEYFARAAFEIGIGIDHLENLYNKLGYRLPWQKFPKEKGDE